MPSSRSPSRRSVTFVSCSADQGSGPTLSPAGISADLGMIPMGGSATVNLTVSPLAAALGLMTMTASAQGYNADLDPCAIAGVGHCDRRDGGRPVDLSRTPVRSRLPGC